MGIVGGVSVDIVRGETTALRERVQTWYVPGINGVGAHSLGVNQSAFRYQLVKYSSPGSGGETFLRAIDALQGSVVSITDDHGEVRTNMLIETVTGHRKERRNYEGDATATRAECTITGQVIL